MFARAVKVLVATSVVAQPASAQAHRRLEIAPALGVYVPSGGVPLPVQLGCPRVEFIPCEFPSFKEARTVAIGGRVTAWLGTRTAIEGSVLYGSSRVTDLTRYTGPDPWQLGAQGNVVLTSLRAVLNVAPRIPAMSVLLMAGPAVIHRFGDGWSEWWKGPTSLGGAVGIGFDIHPGHGLGFRAAIEDYIYSFDSLHPSAYSSEFHHDFVFSLSMGPSFFGQRGRH
jgi:hypothetical protein